MIYLLCTIAAIMAVIVAFILNSMTFIEKNPKIKKALVVLVSIILYIILATYLLKQPIY